MQQSVRRDSATVLTGNVSGMQEIHPVIYRLLERNQKCLFMTTGVSTKHSLESSCQICRVAPLKPTIGGRSLEQKFSQPVGVIVKPVAVGDTVVEHVLFDGEHS